MTERHDSSASAGALSPGQRIAVVGSGISGMSAAYLLSQHHQVSLFEAASCLGGHTATIDVQLDGRTYAVDTGFIVFNDWTYPLFQGLMAHLNVAPQPTEMNFSVHDARHDFEYNGHTLTTMFAQRRNLLRPRFYRMLAEILRFNRRARQDIDAGHLDASITLGDYLDRDGYGADFRERYLLPMGAAIWSASPEDLKGFPALFFLRFFHNHGLLSVDHRPQWYTLAGGSRSYIPALTAPYAERIHLDCPVHSIRRDETGVTLHSPRGDERSILGAMPYQDNEVVLHTDKRLLPRRRRAWTSWNYRMDGRGRCGSGLRDLCHEHPAAHRGAPCLLRHPERQRGDRSDPDHSALQLRASLFHASGATGSGPPWEDFNACTPHPLLRGLLAQWLS